MVRYFRKSLGRATLAGTVLAMGLGSLQAFEEPAKISTSDPLKARSAEANIVGGKIVSDQEKRLDVSERAADELGQTPAAGKLIVPEGGPAGVNPDSGKAAVDVSPMRPVEIGIETALTDHGVRVTRVKPGSPAGEAKLQVNDLIKRVGDRTTLTAKDLDVEFHKHPPLAKVPVMVDRGGEQVELVVTLPAEHEPQAPPPPYSLGDAGATKGTVAGKEIHSEDVIRDESIGWVLGERGKRLVEVMNVLPDTPAARAGLLPNDVILGVDRQRYTEPAAVSVAVHQHQAGTIAVLHVRRGTNEADVGLMLPVQNAAAVAVPNGVGAAGVAQPGVTVSVPFGTNASTLPVAPPPAGVAPGTNGVPQQAVPPGTVTPNGGQRSIQQPGGVPAIPGQGPRTVAPLQGSGEIYQKPGDVLQAPPPAAAPAAVPAGN